MRRGKRGTGSSVDCLPGERGLKGTWSWGGLGGSFTFSGWVVCWWDLVEEESEREVEWEESLILLRLFL